MSTSISLTKQEMVALNSLVNSNYAEKGMTIGQIIGQMKNDVEKGIGSANLTENQQVNLIHQLDTNLNLYNMKVTQTTNEGINAVCFYDQRDSKSIVVYGDIDKGFAQSTQDLHSADNAYQKAAVDFLKKNCADADIKLATGYEDGGSLAQYVTITNSSAIEKCETLNVEGLSNSCVEKYAKEIEASKDKMTSISYYKDYNDPFLHDVAANKMYVDPDANNPAYADVIGIEFDANENTEIAKLESKTKMLNMDESAFDKDGGFADKVTRNQSCVSKIVNEVSDSLAKSLSAEMSSVVASADGVCAGFNQCTTPEAKVEYLKNLMLGAYKGQFDKDATGAGFVTAGMLLAQYSSKNLAQVALTSGKQIAINVATRFMLDMAQKLAKLIKEMLDKLDDKLKAFGTKLSGMIDKMVDETEKYSGQNLDNVAQSGKEATKAAEQKLNEFTDGLKNYCDGIQKEDSMANVANSLNDKLSQAKDAFACDMQDAQSMIAKQMAQSMAKADVAIGL